MLRGVHRRFLAHAAKVVVLKIILSKTKYKLLKIFFKNLCRIVTTNWYYSIVESESYFLCSLRIKVTRLTL